MSENLYHTLSDNDNPDYIERNGPFKCEKENAWLGHGYYFWEDYINNAHWWGRSSYNGNYVICQTISEYDHDKCLDLTNKINLDDFKEIAKYLYSKEIADGTLTFPEILEKLKNKGVYTQKIIKIRSEYTKKFNPDTSIRFNIGKSQFIDLEPPIQICFSDKPSIKIKQFKIVYPPKYADGYVA